MDDYNEIIEIIQVEFGAHYKKSPEILNVPGTSLACKIDPLYYLAMPRALMDALAQWTGLLPEKIAVTLVRTGNMLSSEKDRNYIMPLKLIYAHSNPERTVECCLLDASFIDRTLAIYAGLTTELPIAPLHINKSDQMSLDAFLKGKPPLTALAFGK